MGPGAQEDGRTPSWEDHSHWVCLCFVFLRPSTSDICRNKASKEAEWPVQAQGVSSPQPPAGPSLA